MISTKKNRKWRFFLEIMRFAMLMSHMSNIHHVFALITIRVSVQKPSIACATYLICIQ